MYIDSVKIKLFVNSRKSGESFLRSSILSVGNIKKTLQKGNSKYHAICDRVVLNLGAIPASNVDTEFPLRLAQAVADYFQQQEEGINDRRSSASTDPVTTLDGFTGEPGQVYSLASACLQLALLQKLLRNPPGELQVLLKCLLDDIPSLPACFYRRATGSRLAIAALRYLFRNRRGREWLSEHYPQNEQITLWAEAIESGEIPVELVQDLLLRPDSQILPAQVGCRWLLPLWQRAAIRRTVAQKCDRGTVRQIMACVNRVSQHPVRGASLRSPQQLQRVQQLPALPLSPLCTTPERSPALHRAQQFLSQQQALPRPSLHTAQQPLSVQQPSLSVSNAGLAILWPLLPALFTLLELTQENAFISDSARWQAVVCLSGLACPQEQTTEKQQAVNRLLCGILPDTPQPELRAISPQQQQQLDAWLTAIGRQLPGWQKLGLSDIRALFLQRPGEIVYDTEPPQIIVRQEAFDYLLGDWPWPLTIAALPWLTQPLTLIWPLPSLTG